MPKRLAAAVGPNDLAYVAFTSGSTGAPKGTLVGAEMAYSTIDLFEGRLTLLTGPGGDLWRTALADLLVDRFAAGLKKVRNRPHFKCDYVESRRRGARKFNPSNGAGVLDEQRAAP